MTLTRKFSPTPCAYARRLQVITKPRTEITNDHLRKRSPTSHASHRQAGESQSWPNIVWLSGRGGTETAALSRRCFRLPATRPWMSSR